MKENTDTLFQSFEHIHNQFVLDGWPHIFLIFQLI